VTAPTDTDTNIAGSVASGRDAPLVLVIENEACDPLGPLGDWLTECGLRLHTLRPYTGEPLPDELSDLSGIAGVAGLVVLGGSMGAEEDDLNPWLPGVRRLLAKAVADEVPTLAICLGAQLLAVATGGRVARNPGGPEYGAQLIAKRANSATDPLFAALPITPDVIQWHVDAIIDLPPGAIQLASSPVCAVQAFRLGRLAWGIQFHIETTPDLLRGWAVADATTMLDYDVVAILDRACALDADVTEVWRPFAAAFAAIVSNPSAVPAARPMRISTADPITDPAAIRAALATEMQTARQLPWPGVHEDTPSGRKPV
jgi:GMP synthase (glutamine-hydrolysing)